MVSILDQLHKDHINIEKLLGLFEKELNEFSQRDIEPDYCRWQDILVYMINYQNIFHHPAEDVLFAHLIKTHQELSGVINNLEEEHQQLYEKSSELHDLIGAVVNSQIIIERNRLVEMSRSYIEKLRGHMNIEETRIFPVARKDLNESEIAIIEKETNFMVDPLFGDRLNLEYKALSIHISKEA